jgi:hypothetical protein
MHYTLSGNSKKIKVQRPNSLKIAILILLFYAEDYGVGEDIDRTMTKSRLYEILKAHYGIENSRPIKNQLEMLKAESIIKESDGRLSLTVNPDLLLKTYLIIQDAPDDIFPIYQREMDYLHYIVKDPEGEPKQKWKEVLRLRYAHDPETNEYEYSKEGLFKFFLTGFSFVNWIKPNMLPWCAMRYLAKLVYEEVRTGQPYVWLYSEITEVKERVKRTIGEAADYESVFRALESSVTPELRDKITKTCFNFPGPEGDNEYRVILGGSPSALYFFYNIAESKPEAMVQLVQVSPLDEEVYSMMHTWLISLLYQDFANNELQRFFSYRMEGREYSLNSSALISRELIQFPGVF